MRHPMVSSGTPLRMAFSWPGPSLLVQVVARQPVAMYYHVPIDSRETALKFRHYAGGLPGAGVLVRPRVNRAWLLDLATTTHVNVQ